MADSYFLDTDFTPTLLEDENGNTLIQLGENTAEAAVQAAIATSKAAEASASADTAETAAQAALGAANYYTTIAAGVAATAVDGLFTSDETGSFLYYRKTGSSPFYVAIDPGFLTKVAGQWKADGYNVFRQSHFGYASGYRTLVFGNGANQTVALNYDPINVLSGSGFNGDGREVVVRNGTNFITPNAAQDNWLNPMSFLDGNVICAGNVNAAGSRLSSGSASNVDLTFANANNAAAIRLNASGHLTLCYNNVGVYTPSVHLDQAGNVGIGTTSPQSRLHVEAGSVAQNLIATSGNATLRLANSATSGTRKELTITLDNTNNRVDIQAIQQGVAARDITLNAGGGNVGVGTASPATKLDVDGPIRPKSYTVGTVPSATSIAGAMIYVSNETGGAVPAFSDGTNWRRVTDRAVIA